MASRTARARSAARLVLVTHPTRGARAFARALVRASLAACVNHLTVRSVYRWRGRLEAASEALLVIKTTRARVGALERFVVESHPYDCPEFVVFTPEHVEERYLAWLGTATGTSAARRSGHAGRAASRPPG